MKPIPEEKIREVLHGYHAATAYTDADIGKVVGELKRLGLAERTIIVLSARTAGAWASSITGVRRRTSKSAHACRWSSACRANGGKQQHAYI